jgi:hypothetical protein
MFTALAAHPWAYPALEAVHLLGMALLLGNLVLLELRLWGWASGLPLGLLARAALPLVLLGFGLSAATGLLMFATQPLDLLANRVFTLKMGLLMLAGGNAAWFHARGGLQRSDGWSRAQTLLSLGLWLTVLGLGRWIAYS